MKALDETQLVSLLTAIRHSRLYAPTLLAATTGLRRGEILGLRWSDADADTGEIQVVRSLQESPDGLSFKTPKTRKGRRSVLLPKLAISALKAHRVQQNEERLMLGPGYQDHDLIGGRHPLEGDVSREGGQNLVHANASITLNVYSHVLPGMQREAVDKIDAALGAAAGE